MNWNWTKNCLFSSYLKGVQVGDEVLHFGSVNTDNFSGLAAIGEIVLHANGVC